MAHENIQEQKVPTYCGMFKELELSSGKHGGFFSGEELWLGRLFLMVAVVVVAVVGRYVYNYIWR